MERPGGDYAELLGRVRVTSPAGAKARADKVRVATIRDGEPAIALTRCDYTDAEVRAELERGDGLGRLATQAREHSHELGPWLRPRRREHH